MYAGSIVKHLLATASIVVRTLEYSTTEVTSTWLLPEMVVRVANMLNYFLQFLTGQLPDHIRTAASVTILCPSKKCVEVTSDSNSNIRICSRNLNQNVYTKCYELNEENMKEFINTV